MKFTTALIALASMPAALASKAISGPSAAAKVLRSARRLEQGNQAGDDNQQEEQYDYLAQYSLKLIGCKAGTSIANADGNGEYEYSAAIFRLCPTESGCSDEGVTGCKSGYGDFVVGLNTFVQAYFEDQRDNMNWDDQFQVDRYAECAEYEMENDDDQAAQYWVGPMCTEDELDVKLAVFDDEICTQESSSTFGEISNGWTLPFSEGGMVSTYCSDCLEYDEDQAAYQLRDMCMQLYTGAAYACEQSMEYFSQYNGQNVENCEYVEDSLPSAVKKSMRGGAVFGWIIFALLIVGIACYVVWWRSKKQSQAAM